MKRIIGFLIFLPFSLFAQDLPIIPEPVHIVNNPGFATLSALTTLYYTDDTGKKSASFFRDYLKETYHLSLKIKSGHPATENEKAVIFQQQNNTNHPDGAYALTVKNDMIIIEGKQAGIFYGTNTLIQLLPVEQQASGKLNIPACYIYDYPRFAYRGMHLDVSRHFFDIAFIRRYIDYLAYHKFNYFHWHLTDDQGWRIEIKKYPNLTKTGAWRNGTIMGHYPGKGNDNKTHGGYYTQEQVKDIVKYAADRFITVIPEIEMPGHSSAAIAAYPWLSCFPDEPTKIPLSMISQKSMVEQQEGRIKLVQETWGVFNDVFCAGKDSTFRFLEDVLDEVMKLFPSKYIHVGGDECPKENWKRCPHCQERIKAEHLKDEHALQSYFIQRIEKFLNRKGRTLIGWDEILEGGLAQNAIVMSWRGEKGGIEAAQQNHFVIMTPGNPVYFDHAQSEQEDSLTIGGYNPLEKVYAYEPIPKELNKEQSKFVMGAQANVWTEYMDNPKKVEYMIFPRLSALSEILWSPGQNLQWTKFEKKLPTQFQRYGLWNATYSKAFYDLKSSVRPPTDDEKGVIWEVIADHQEDRIQFEAFPASDTGKIEPSPISGKPGQLAITHSGTYTANRFGAGENQLLSSITQNFILNKATGKRITLLSPLSEKYPGDGAFTLVNGIQNEKGLSKSKEFLGFAGTDCIAIIDLGQEERVGKVVVHFFEQENSWIWKPRQTRVLVSENGTSFNLAAEAGDQAAIPSDNGNGKMVIQLDRVNTRFIKIIIDNWGEIPAGKPGAGNKAWLFIDEIEVLD
ncbi:MAG: family 20 glycosylhydrolase [Terrimonas sp.]|nr:family 20 glycosylhydrolase [Terrimonas sp.]